MTNSLKSIIPIIILALLTVGFYWKILLTNLILIGTDIFLYFYPYKAYASQALLSGRLPLWNPHIFMGVPFLANSQVGLLYPLNWLFLWAEPPKQIAYSIALHVWIAGMGAYLFAKYRLKLDTLSAFIGGVIFAFSGFLGAQVEHINQLQVSAWLPWIFFISSKARNYEFSLARGNGQTRKVFENLSCLGYHRKIAMLGLIIALMLLAGHTQSVYISMFGLGIYILGHVILSGLPLKNVVMVRQERFSKTFLVLATMLPKFIFPFMPLIFAIMLALLISAGQLLPTIELAGHSIRSGGLTYNEVVAFSLNPLKSWLTFLPPYGIDLEKHLGAAFSEFIAYIGMIPLILVMVGLWNTLKKNGNSSLRVRRLSMIFVGGVGFILAFGLFTGPIYAVLYRFVPGFDLFRVPARWLLLYTFSVAMMSAVGFQWICYQRFAMLKKAMPAIITALIIFELFMASQALRYNHPTAPEAYDFLRPSIVQLQAIQKPTDRFLSLSGIRYDPGDLSEIHNIYDDQLSERAVYDYIVSVKQKEVLAFNLPMIYNLNAVDGYDGGLLPLKRFIDLQRLFLADDNLSLDGRLREKLNSVPSSRLLSLLGVRYIITDKVQDVWINHIFYDLQFPAKLTPKMPEISTTNIPPLPATAIGVIFKTSESGNIGKVIVHYENEVVHLNIITNPENMWIDNYINVLEGLSGEPIKQISIHVNKSVIIKGISLIHQPSITSRSVILSTEGDYQVVHDGDIKLYENRQVYPRAFIVHKTEIVPNIETAITTMKKSSDALNKTIHVADEGESIGIISRGKFDKDEHVTITDYHAERIELTTHLKTPAWLVLTDTYYPGWHAFADGTEIPISEVDIMFRSIPLASGEHKIVFVYRPKSVYWGMGLSILGMLLFVGLMLKRKILHLTLPNMDR